MELESLPPSENSSPAPSPRGGIGPHSRASASPSPSPPSPTSEVHPGRALAMSTMGHWAATDLKRQRLNAAGTETPEAVLKEGDRGADSDSSEDTDNGTGQEMANWQEWRSEFPLDVLDELAIFYEAFPRSANGVREVPRCQVEEVVLDLLGLPMAAFEDEVAARKSPSNGEPLIFYSFQNFLELLRSTSTRAEWHYGSLMWPSKSARIIRSSFTRYCNLADRMPTAQLFEMIKDLGIESLNVDSVEQQRCVAEVIAKTLQEHVSSKVPPGQRGTMNFEDAVRVLTLAIRGWQRRLRREEFTREWQAQQAAGFTLLEMEDLREMHRTYELLEGHQQIPKTGESRGPVGWVTEVALDRFVVLLRRCGMRKLWEHESGILHAIVRSSPGDPCRDATPVSLETFVGWMGEVFARGLGDLKRQEPPKDGGDDEGPGDAYLCRRGFCAAMVRETARGDRRHHNGEVDPSMLGCRGHAAVVTATSTGQVLQPGADKAPSEWFPLFATGIEGFGTGPASVCRLARQGDWTRRCRHCRHDRQ